MAVVGSVLSLYRYPVKSMAAEPLATAEVGWQGITGDRRWAFVRGGMERNGFPWLTLREQPGMAQYRPRFADAQAPDSSLTLVTSPAGIDYDVADPRLAEELGFASHVIRQARGVFDAFPLSVISDSTIGAIGAAVGENLDARRFRPNVVVQFTDPAPFLEDGLIGREISLGSVVVRLDKRDKRCVAINVDPSSSSKNPAVLKAVARERQACLGVYASVVRTGSISAGDSVSVVR
jgi:uncharacterized protein YcbX